MRDVDTSRPGSRPGAGNGLQRLLVDSAQQPLCWVATQKASQSILTGWLAVRLPADEACQDPCAMAVASVAGDEASRGNSWEAVEVDGHKDCLRAQSTPLACCRVAGFEVDLHLRTPSESPEEEQLRGAVEDLTVLVRQGFPIDHSVFSGVLKRCTLQRNLVLGSCVHALIVSSGHGSNAFLANHIICMYGSHGRLEDAREVFTKVAVPSHHMWASLTSAYARNGQPRGALQLYRQMRVSKLKPHSHVYVAVLKACALAQDLSFGREVHADILSTGDRCNIYVGASLVGMYSKCGSLGDARRVFDSLSVKDVVTWNAMISGYSQNRLGQDAINLHVLMQQEGTQPNRETFLCLLQACSSLGDVQQGKNVHAQIQKRDLEDDVVVGNCLIHMYGKLRSVKDARTVFDKLARKNAVTWSSMLAGYAHNGLTQEALDLYACMQQAVTPVDRVTFICLLHAFASIGALLQGQELHALIHARGLLSDRFIANGLVNMYVKCGSLYDARKVFDNMPSRDVVTWNAIITGYAQHGCGEEALTLHGMMQEEGVSGENAVTFICLLKACASSKALYQGKRLHAQILERGLEADLLVGTCLVDMYAKCGSLQDAQSVFDNLPARDVVTWNTMIAGYAQHGHGQKSFSLYESMLKHSKILADVVTYVYLLQACAMLKARDVGRQLHLDICERGLQGDLVVGNALVNMYAMCGSLEDARQVLDGLDSRDVVTWNSMIKGYAQHGLYQEALTLYTRMQQEGVVTLDVVTFVSLLQACAKNGALDKGKDLHARIQEVGLDADVTIGNCLVNMYAKCGSLSDARKVFDKLATKDVVTWNVLMGGYIQQGFGHEALIAYESMQHERVTPPDAVTFLHALQACSSMMGLEKGKEIHAQVCKIGLRATDIFVANALIDMYGSCGTMAHAQEVFDSLSVRDIFTWNALIAGYSCQGYTDLTFELLQKMGKDGVPPNSITFASVLAVCSHAGLVEKGQEYFQAMCTDYCISPTVEHYNCMVDLFGRAGYVTEAMEMVTTMPFQPSKEVWRCLLGACQKWSNVEIGRHAFECAVRLEKTDPSPYLLMSNIYAAAGMWKEAENIRAMRVETNAWKVQAQSWWADIDGMVHMFVVGDREDMHRRS